MCEYDDDGWWAGCECVGSTGVDRGDADSQL